MEKVFARVRLYLEISLAVARTSQSPFPLAFSGENAEQTRNSKHNRQNKMSKNN